MTENAIQSEAAFKRISHQPQHKFNGVNFMVKKTIALMFVVIACGCWTAPVDAQLSRDVRDVFEGMMDELDPGLQKKFKQAIENDSTSVEFTAKEFLRFRANPANPFQGLDKIVPDLNGGNISLKFELPSMRKRPVNNFERQSPIVLSQIREPVQSAAVSTVTINSGDRQLALGIVVKSDGYVLTKASEVDNRKTITCVFQDGRKLDAKLIRTDSKNDLAILKVDAKGLPTINWSNTQLRTGAFVMTPSPDGSVIALGTYSVLPHSTAEGEQAFLGVEPVTTTTGVRISKIERRTASYKAGLRDGDVIRKLGGVVITDVASLVKTIRDRRPGDQVEIEFLRLGTASKTTATLAGRMESGEQAARLKMMNRLGAIVSRRDDNFPSVFQHDSPLFPEQCGGPITDLDGNVIGINIARHGRAATYAIPTSHLKTLLKDLLRSNLASR